MSVSILIIACFTALDLRCVKCFNDFVRKYDVVDVEITEHRVRRSSLDRAYLNVSDSEIDLEIRFTSFRKNFHLLLLRDISFQEIPVESYFSGNITQNKKSLRAEFYEGNLKHDSSNSSVFGYVIDGLFTGKISDGDIMYFVEPASTHLSYTPSDSQKIIVYRDADITPLPWKIFPRYPKSFPEWSGLYRSPDIFLNVSVGNSGFDNSNRTGDLFCEIEIVADHTLYNFFENDTDKVSAVLYFHAKFADYIFRRSDFDMDGSLDGIRITVGKISIYKSNDDDNYPMLDASSLSDYLSLLISRKQNSEFCLSIAMVYRNYGGKVIGEAVKPHLRFTEAFGGICDPPVQSNDGLGTLSFNTGVVNMQFENGRRLPLAVTLLALAHEVGHGFGSGHDPINDPICSPGKFDNYLMYAFASYGSKNAMKFSRCSRKAILEILRLKGGCLKSRNSTCGNGIREGDEECDCGSEIPCKLIDPCCTPSDAKPPEKGCTFRSSKGFKCSPRESECCGKNCLPVPSKLALCYSDSVLCLYSFCDGRSSVCPKPQKIQELCRPTFTCDNGTCSNVSVCGFMGLKDCLCKDVTSTQCLQCCQNKGVCTAASELGFFDSSGKPYTLQPGTKCIDGQHTCDSTGRCIADTYLVSTTIEFYVTVIVVPLFISLLLIIAMFTSIQGDSNNNVVQIRNDT